MKLLSKTITSTSLKKRLIGLQFKDGLLFKVIIYALLIGIGFVYVYPLLYMISISLQDLADLLSPSVLYIPSKLYLDNIITSFEVLKYLETLLSSLTVTLFPAILQTFVASLIGYGFAKFEFPLKRIIFAIVILTYIIPPQLIMIPRFVLFNDLNLVGTIWSILLPASLGQGLYSAVFILIFYQFYKMIPKALEEAAQIDGASPFYVYIKIAVPLSVPSFITSFLFSFVWYWNETYTSSLMLNNLVETLQLRLLTFVSSYQDLFPGEAALINEGIRMSATLLIILPMLIVYIFIQKLFIQGIDQSGLAGGEQ